MNCDEVGNPATSIVSKFCTKCAGIFNENNAIFMQDYRGLSLSYSQNLVRNVYELMNTGKVCVKLISKILTDSA